MNSENKSGRSPHGAPASGRPEVKCEPHQSHERNQQRDSETGSDYTS